MSRLIHLSRKAAATATATATATGKTTTSSLLSNPSNTLQVRNHYYMNRLFPLSNSSFQLSTGNALQANVVRLTDHMFLVDSGIATPKTCLQDELVGVQHNNIRFENRVGFLDLVSSESSIRLQILERFFIDLVAGDKTAKERAVSRFNDLVGGSNVDSDNLGAGGPQLVLPRRYRQKRVAMELSKSWRNNSQVKGFYVGRNRSGFAVAIAGFVAFFPNRPYMGSRKKLKDRFTIESFNSKTGNIVVL